MKLGVRRHRLFQVVGVNQEHHVAIGLANLAHAPLHLTHAAEQYLLNHPLGAAGSRLFACQLHVGAGWGKVLTAFAFGGRIVEPLGFEVRIPRDPTLRPEVV